MKKTITLLFFSLILAGCAFTSNSESSTSQNSENSISQNPVSASTSSSDETSVSDDLTSGAPSISDPDVSTSTPKLDIDALKEQYGEFNITNTKGEEGVLSSDGKTYTISVSSSKSAFTIKGFFEGRIIINNDNELASFKGVELTLENACLFTDSGINIDYQVNDKNVEIVAKKNTENYIINLGEGNDDAAVNSEKNIEIDGKGILNIFTQTGHALKADKKIKLYDAPTLNITAGHDAIHASEFISNNEEELEADFEEFNGTLNVLSALSQAFDCTTSKGKGLIQLLTGTYNISNCESAFKTDVSLTIGGQVIATNLSSDPVVKGDNSTGVTIEITDTGSFTVDGVSYTLTNV